MTDKERIKQLEKMLADARAALAVERFGLVEKPQHPEPGTVVEWWEPGRPRHKFMGIVSAKGSGVVDNLGDCYQWDEIEYRRAYIVTPPPLEEWADSRWEWIVYEHQAHLSGLGYKTGCGQFGRHIATITREDMEKLQ